MNPNINSFLIHYTKLSNRLENALSVLAEIGLSPEIVSCWDGDNLHCINDEYSSTELLWLRHVIPVAPILLANAGYAIDPALEQYLHELIKMPLQARTLLPHWMHPRSLSRGEMSVLLKHYYAISRIALGKHTYGLIAEDDIVLHPSSSELFYHTYTEFCNLDGDYLDLAGGCGLVSADYRHHYVSLISPPSTRTNACYLLSKRLAKLIVERFFPVSLPIDWHLLYLLNSIDVQGCYWSKQECFIHGSESGVYKSWRSD